MVKKYLNLIIFAFIALALLFYDLTIEMLTELLHLMFELAFDLFEWIELGIEHAVEHIFHTSHHGSQIVTFYILVSIACFILYWLWLVLPVLYLKLKQFILAVWVRRKTEWELLWFSLTLSHKVILLITALGLAYVASFFLM